MWAGSRWDTVHKDVYKYGKCDMHSHADLEDMNLGIWRKDGKDPNENWIRLKVMEPFLFMQPYAISHCNMWAKAAGLLRKENFIADGHVDDKTKNIIVLVDTVAYYLPWMLQFIQVLSQNCQQTRSLLVQNKRTAGDLMQCVLLDEATKCIAHNGLYKIFKKMIPLDVYNEKMLSAAFCITFVSWHHLLKDDWHNHDVPSELGTKLTEEQLEQKKLGNEEYNKNTFFQAVATYTKIIKSTPDNPIIYGNRAQAFLKLSRYNEAEIDSRRTVVLDPLNFKGYLKMAKAKEGLNDLHAAHELASFAYSFCSGCGKSCTELFDFSSILKEKCENEGPCMPDQKFRHQVNIPTPKETYVCTTADLPDLESSSDESSDKEESSSSILLEDVQKDTTPAPPKMFEFNLLELLQQLKTLQQQGSELLLAGNHQEAVDKYLQALEIIPKLAEQNYDTDPEDKVCLKYALGVAYQAGSPENLLSSLEVFQEILNNYGDLNFTPAHSGIGETYMKLYRFEQALEHLTIALEWVEEKKLYQTYKWPGSKNVIEDSIPEKQKERMRELIQLCQYPPNPDAICRSDVCLLPSRNIYVADPEFKGYFRLSCETGCKLEYHSQCWKRVKENLDRNKKGVVGQICLTPDCGALVTGLEKFDNEGELLSRSVVAGEKDAKPKKTKTEKRKDARRNQKQRERSQQSSICENEEQPTNAVPESTTTPETITTKVAVTEPTKSTESTKPTIPPSYAVNDEPVYVIRKGDSMQSSGVQNEKTSSTPVSSKKRKKNKKSATISAQEFCGELLENEATAYNQYLRRVQDLQRAKNKVEEGGDEFDWPPLTGNFTLNADSPFFIPEHLRDNPEELEQALRRHTAPTPAPAPVTPVQIEDQNEGIKDNIYSYMEELLLANGPLPRESQVLIEEVSCFPTEAQSLISDYGGLISFLKQDERFVVDDKFVHVVQEDPSEDVSEKPDPEKVINNVMEVNTDSSTILKGHEKELSVDTFGEPSGEPAVDNTSDVRSYSSQGDGSIRRSDSWESNKSSRSNKSTGVNNVDSQLTTSKQALLSLQKLSKSFSTDLQVAMFKLQVSISALSTVEQQQIVCSVINSVKCNLDADFWTNINPLLETVHVSVKGSEHENKEFQLYTEEIENLKQGNKNLEERLSSALDTITKLHKNHAQKKREYEEELAELKMTKEKLQLSLNSVQSRVESEKLHIQQERTKAREEISNMKKEKEEEVATARSLLTKVTEENEKLKKEVDKERDNYKRLKLVVTSLVENCEEATKQAQSAKEDLVKLKESEGLKLLDAELEYAIKTKALLLDNKKKTSPALHPSLYQVFIEKPLQDCEVYHKSLKDLKNSFVILVNEHLEAIQKGLDPPETSLSIPTLPTKPESLQTMGQQAALGMLPMSNASTSLLGKPPLQMNSFPAVSQVSRSQSPAQTSSIPLSTTLSATLPSAPSPVFQNNFFQPNLQPAPLIPNLYSTPPAAGLGYPPTVPLVQHHVPQVEIPRTSVPLLSLNSAVHHASTTANGLADSKTQVPVNNFTSLVNQPVLNAAGSGIQRPVGTNLQPSVLKSLSNLVSSSSSVPDVRRAPLSIPPGMAPLTNRAAPPGLSSQINLTRPTGLSNGDQHSIPVQSVPAGSGVKSKLDAQQVPLSKASVSTTSSSSSTSHNPKSFDKLIRRLREVHPMMTSVELENYIQEFRSQHKGRLSGMTIDKIIEGVSALIQRMPKQEVQKARVITPAFERGTGREQMLRRPYSGLEAIDKGALGLKGNSKDPWGASSSASSNWSGSEDNTCSICLESMPATAVIHETECKHRFHFKCIQEWLKRNSKCPNCNSHTLLPTEFPPLGSS